MADGNDGRIAIVTGAARGIGRGIALRLAADGLDVAVADLAAMRADLEGVAEEIAGMGRRTLALDCDVTVAADVDALVAGVADGLGRLDVMVANAGVVQVAPLLDTRVEDFDALMAVNLRGVFLTYTAAARQMIAQGGGGKIIGAASVAAHRGAPLLAPYCASKFGVRGLTQSAAQEWGAHGITVNAYCPGIVDTKMWEQIDTAFAAREGLQPREAIERMTERIALGRLEHPEDVAAFVSYLASPGSDYMTGQCVIIDGGMAFS
jgi:meso-butanediol dehydrogenase/(S,S)-butanediol dehydrogenase/diacetyl reductase